MLNSIISELADLASLVINTVGHLTSLWPIAVMAGFMVLGVAIGFIKSLAGKKGKRRGR